MHGEYECLTEGRLGWAMGAVTGALGWQLRFGVLGVVCASIALIAIRFYLFSEPWLQFHLFINNLEKGLPHGIHRLLGYGIAGLTTALYSLVLGLWRGRHIVLTAGIMGLATLINGYVMGLIVFGNFILTYAHWHDLPPVIGELTVFSECLLGVYIGASIKRVIEAKIVTGAV